MSPYNFPESLCPKSARLYRNHVKLIDTVHRELMEEIGAEVKELVYLGALENIFTFDGTPGHEIVQVYDGAFVDSGLYGQDVISGHESGENLPMEVIW